MDPEDDIDAIDEFGALPGGLNAAAPAVSVDELMRQYRVDRSAVAAQNKANLDLLNAARSRLRDKRVGPSDTERLFAIAAALGQPTRTGTFGETMGNLGALLGKYSGAQREAEEARALKEYELDSQIGTERLRALQGNATSTGQLLRAMLVQQAARDKAAAAAGKRRTGFNPVTGELVYMDTGEVVRAEAELPVLTPEQVAEAKAAGKRMRFRTVDGREMEI